MSLDRGIVPDPLDPDWVCEGQADILDELRPKLLDLFCGEGGAAMGYHRAGYDVTGVDIAPMPRYPFTFVHADALEYLAAHGHEYDAIHASPTCQTFAAVTEWRGSRDNHPDLLAPTLQMLAATDLPWVVENVPEAPLRRDYVLCGTQFGLKVRRHRVFQRGGWSAYDLVPPCHCYRNHALMSFEHKDERAYADALGCEWMTAQGGRQAVPPAYTEYIGGQMLGAMAERAA